MESLINNLIAQGYLKTPSIIRAFKRIDRVDFVLPEFKNSAAANVPLPIGYEQTISQPLTIAFMLELLAPKSSDKILDIGSGSGWTTALLAEIVGKKGRVLGIEVVPELCEFGRSNVSNYFAVPSVVIPAKAGIQVLKKGKNSSHLDPRALVATATRPGDDKKEEENHQIKIICADGSRGYPQEAPYDRILVSAASNKFPIELKKQIKIGGKIVIPIRSSIWLIERLGKNKFREEEFYGFSFVPLINKPH